MAATSDSSRRYRGLTAHERSAQRRRRLLDAGLAVFGTDGYAASTIPGLCAQAGVSTAHFYEEFAGREALLVAVYEEVVGELANGVVAAMEAAEPTVEAVVRAALGAFVAPLVADERWARVNFVEIVGVSEGFEARRRGVLRAFAAITAEAAGRLVAGGLLPERDLALTAMALVGAVQETLDDWFGTPPAQRRDMGAVLDELERIHVAVLS